MEVFNTLLFAFVMALCFKSVMERKYSLPTLSIQ